MSDKIGLSDPYAADGVFSHLHAKQSAARDHFHRLIFEREYLKVAIEHCRRLHEVAQDVPDCDTITVKVPAKVLRDLTLAAEGGKTLRVRLADVRADISEADDLHYSTIFALGEAYAEKRILDKGDLRHFPSQANDRD